MKNFIKNFIIAAGVFCMAPVAVFANVMRMEMVSDFSSENPQNRIQLKLVQDAFVYDNEFFPSNTIINCDVSDVVDPKRLKRSASFSCKPVNYARKGEEVKEFKTELNLKFLKILDKKDITKNVATTVASTAASHFVPGLGIGVKAVVEAAEAENGERLKAGLHGAYESTPLSYIEKGMDLDLVPGDIILVNISKKTED